MSRRSFLLVSLAMITGCSGENALSPQAANGLDETAIREVASELAIQKGMNLLCGREDTGRLSVFMEDLRYEQVDRLVRESIAAESVELMNKISAEEPEYICTPEMFESADKRVTQALLTWDEMRGITQ